MVAEQGFEKIGINAVATQSGVSKILIYRYFGSMEGLMAAYICQYDFWLNFPLEFPSKEELPAFVKKMFKLQIDQLRNNPTLKRLYRWELSSNNDLITKLREQINAGIDVLVDKVLKQHSDDSNRSQLGRNRRNRPANASNKNVTWNSSNPTVAYVTDGAVKGEKAGTATITATTVNGGKTATCVVTVENVTVASASAMLRLR